MDLDEMRYARFLNGDHSALEELIGTYRESLTLFIYRYTKDFVEAENIMIDVFAQLVVSRKQFRGESTLKTYLFTIGRNEALRYLKKNKRQIRLQEQHKGVLREEIPIEFSVFQEERNRQLYTVMETLHREYREVLFLLYFEDVRYKEAGKIMKKSEKQITNLAYRGKKALKEKLEKEGFTYYE